MSSRTGFQIYRTPAAIALLTIAGLLSALISDSWGDVFAWLTLGAVVVTGAWFSLKRPS